jgi:DNA-binding PadR family transcriptional regulator
MQQFSGFQAEPAIRDESDITELVADALVSLAPHGKSVEVSPTPALSIGGDPIYHSSMTDTPLTEPAFLILTALADQPLHGYGMIEDVKRISDGVVTLHAGTLYTVLDRLSRDGLIEVDHEEVVQSRLRRYYRLTTAGAQRLAVESARLARHASVANRRLRRHRPALGGGGA